MDACQCFVEAEGEKGRYRKSFEKIDFDQEGLLW
jgi:hypothetical protein